MNRKPENEFDKLIIVGDRVLIKPKSLDERTKSGLFLPPGYQEKEEVRSGYVIKAGPGFPIPVPLEDDDSWKGRDERVKYIPLQAREGDLAIFLQRGAYEIIYNNEKYFIVPQQSILMLEREADIQY